MSATIGDPSLHAQFDAFDRAHPHVFLHFKRVADAMYNEMVRAGKTPVFGAKFVWERLRWQVKLTVDTPHGTQFKLDNDMVSRYARKLAAEDPRFESVFRFRKLKPRVLF